MEQIGHLTERNSQLQSRLDESERLNDECNVQLNVERFVNE